MKKSLLFLFICFALGTGYSIAQTNPADALNEAPLKVQTWFYERYQNAELVNWIRKEIGGSLYHEASFKYKGNSIVALYDKNGAIKEEIVVNKKPVLTQGIKIYIDQNFAKFKIVGLKSVKIFSKNKTDEFSVYYELIGKNKQDQISFWFNESNEIISETDFASYASLD